MLSVREYLTLDSVQKTRLRNVGIDLWGYFKDALGLKKEVPSCLLYGTEEIERYHRLRSSQAPNILDQQTISDLDIVGYTDKFFADSSIFGRQSLYDRLRSGVSRSSLARCKSEISKLITNEEWANEILAAVRPLRGAEAEISGLLFDRCRSTPVQWGNKFWIVQLLAVGSILATAVSWFALLGFIASFFTIIYFQIVFHKKISLWEEELPSLLLLLDTTQILLKLNASPGHALTGALSERRRQIENIRKQLKPSILVRSSLWLGEYANWFFLNNIVNYHNAALILFRNASLLQDAFVFTAEVEVEVNLSNHLRKLDYCWCEFSDTPRISMEGAYHPFLEQPIPLDFDFQGKSVFLSGQNGIGKSTLLRSIGLNFVLGRSFGFCYARSATVACLPILSSINIGDSISEGTSSYIAEVKRAEKMFALSMAHGACIFLIDEIFKGTNHLESVSASASVLHALASKSLVIALFSQSGAGTDAREAVQTHSSKP